jgi:uncharacterized membrane protein
MVLPTTCIANAGIKINTEMCFRINAFLNVNPNIASDIDIKNANKKANHNGYSEKTTFCCALIGVICLLTLEIIAVVGLCIICNQWVIA